MTAITINIPNHEVSFFKKMMAKMGWTYSEADVALTKCQTLCELRPAPVWNIYKRWKESDYQVITLSRSWDRSLKGLANKKCEVPKLN